MSQDIKPTEEKPVETPAEKTEEKTVDQIIKEANPAPEPKKDPEPEMVPLASFLELKKENKEFKKSIEDLQRKITEGDLSKKEITPDIKALADKYDIDPSFVSELTTTIMASANSQVDKKVSEITKPILAKEEELSKKELDKKLDEAFQKAFNTEMEKSPEYKDIANADVIKALSFLPENKNKTFAQLIEETYGKAITGKRTISDTTPGGGKDPDPIDYNRAKTDTEYFKTIMANPALKKEYNAHMLAPVKRRS